MVSVEENEQVCPTPDKLTHQGQSTRYAIYNRGEGEGLYMTSHYL